MILLRKILVVSAAFVVVFVLVAFGTTHQFFNPATDTQPIASSSPKNSPNPSKPEQSTFVQSADNLSSQKGVDYTRLRDLLKAGNWKDADRETYLVMRKVVGGKEGNWISPEHWLNFPCTDLRTIDSLWVKYSNGRFGFSVQKKIYLSVGGKPDGKYYSEAWNKFGDAIGWRVKQSWIDYSQVTFDTTAPVGHLPVYIVGGEEYVALVARLLVNCSL